MTDLSRIRNFCIIAHIDHGKSTLADRMLEMTQTVEQRKMKEQVLDAMDLERERGITIKSHPVCLKYTAKDGKEYQFNLMDTPGHVDFSYEVSRSLAACDGAVLVVDAAQGVEAQTVSNAFLASEEDLVMIPVLNKVDLPNADTDAVSQQIEDILAIDATDAIHISAKSGMGVVDVMEAIVERIPAPKPAEGGEGVTRALVFDSKYDAYQGVIIYVRMFNGAIKKGDRMRVMSTGNNYEVKQVGKFVPDQVLTDELTEGEVGFITANMKDPSEIKIGDTITLHRGAAEESLPGFQEIQPMVFAGLYPVDTAEYEKLAASLDKLVLNDCSFSFSNESSLALGLGFRCGFLGLLHMEIITERLRREYNLNLITTYPAVEYHVHLTNGTMVKVDNPIYMPDITKIQTIEEPRIKAYIICWTDHIGDMMQLVLDRRGQVTNTASIDGKRVMLTCDLPLNEILIDFYDKLKTVSRGYASMDYEHSEYRADDMVKLDIMVHGEIIDAFSSIVHRTKAVARGRQMCKSLKDILPRQAFSVPVQAALNSNIIARETIQAFRKDVTAKCYGGDISRKRKLLEKQKEGKKKLKLIGKVSIPQDAFIQVLKSENQ
jgi:GTP-binding protein LepA